MKQTRNEPLWPWVAGPVHLSSHTGSEIGSHVDRCTAGDRAPPSPHLLSRR